MDNIKRYAAAGFAAGMGTMGIACCGLASGASKAVAVVVGAFTATAVSAAIGVMFDNYDTQRRRRSEHRRRIEAACAAREYRYRNYHRKSDPFFEPKNEPIRKVCGALAEDFANAPEDVKREICG